ncbi:MAG: ATP-binding protein [Planctomycetes bacterium]|nr:ATP-binding protein [Planctomycetota bacterium]
MRFYLESFEKHKAEGLSAWRAGDRSEARWHLLKAAEYLYRLAERTEGELRAARLRSAGELVGLARRIRLARGGATPAVTAAESSPAAAPRVADGSAPTPADDWIVRERPTTRFADVAGLEAVKEEIRVKMLYPFLHPEQAERYRVRRGGGLLLYGPPGTGKTLVARAVAGELEAVIFSITPSSVMSKWVGEAEKNVTALFAAARACPRAVIFVDEIEALLPSRRESDSPVMQRVVPQLLAELDGFAGRPAGLLFLGATNEPWSLDHAALRPGRFDTHVYVGLPDRAARATLLGLHARGLPLAPAVDLAEMAGRLDGWSGADIANLCRRTGESVFRESVERGSERAVGPADFAAAHSGLRPSESAADLRRFAGWRAGE